MEKKDFNVVPSKFEKEPGTKDIKPADQSADNDMDRSTPQDEPSKKATDEAYIKNSSGPGGNVPEAKK